MTDLWAAPSSPTFGGRFVRIFALGLIGLLALVPTLLQILTQRSSTEFLNLLVLEVGSMFLPLAIVLLVAAALGAGFAPRVGLRSQIAEGGIDVGSWWVVAIVVGLAVGASLVGLDALFVTRPYPSGAAFSKSPVQVVTAILLGGLTQEILLRWGLLTLFAWVGWRIFQRGRDLPNTAVMAVAVVLSALCATAGPLLHLLQGSIVSDPLLADVAFRYVLSNLAFGVLYWSYGLEAAVVAHAAALLVTTVVGVAPL
jgi:hypothetical protein